MSIHRSFARLRLRLVACASGASIVAALIVPLASGGCAGTPGAGSRGDASAGREREDGEGRSLVRGDGLAPREPNPWFHNERAYPFRTIPRDAWRAAQAQAVALKQAASAAGAPAWTPRGPTNVGGRITDLAVDPTDANVVYAAAADGGVLRTVDGGAHWTPLFDDQPSLAVGAVAIDPFDPQVIYAGTGEVNPGGGSTAYGGAGVFRSDDGGDSWTSIGLEESGSIGRIVVDPTNSNRIFVAAMGHLWERSDARGVYRTFDGGATWERVLFVGDETGCVDLVMRPDDPQVIFAAMWERLRQPEFYDYGGPTCAIHRSDDGGDTWTIVGGGLPAPGPDGGRIGISLCTTQPDVMHAAYADRIGYFDGLYRSTDGGATWTRTSDASLAGAFASYGWWFGNVRTHPLLPDTIYLLGLDLHRSTNGGASYATVSGGMHVDHHALAFGPGATPILYAGNDGGVYRSANGSTWTKLPDLPITQAYRIALDAGNANATYIGAQDNSTCRTLTGALDDWSVIYGGDGFQPLVHPLFSTRIWAQYQYGNVGYSSNGGASFGGATSGIAGADRRNWNAPLVQDPANPDRRYFGTHRVYRSVTNTSWTAISGDLTGGVHQGNAGQVNGTLTTISVSPLDAGTLWTGSDDGRVHVTTNGGASWTDVSAGLPVRWITSVRADPFDAQAAYVTVSGFRWAEPLTHVFRTTDLGATWTPIAGDLPEAPVNDLVADPDEAGRLYVATDVGVYETRDGGASWSALGTGLPNVVVLALAHDVPNDELRAATFGRSVFAISVAPPACPLDLDGDGAVGFGDLLVVLGAWGPNPGAPADLDGSGTVDFDDLLAVLAGWGSCGGA